MYKEGKIAPIFSLAILRNVSGPSGYLTLGGLPPINFIPVFVSTPIVITSIEGYPDTLDFYTIEPDAITLGNKALKGSGGGVQYIVRLAYQSLYFHLLISYFRWTLARH